MSSKPASATRWPSWDEVTSKPDLITKNSTGVFYATAIDVGNNGIYNGVIGLGRKSATGGSYASSYTGWQIQNYNNNLQFYCDSGQSVVAYINTAGIYHSSDRRKKKNIQEIDRQSLDNLFDVSDRLFKKFTWKHSGKETYGFIAQELEQWIPEAVNTDIDKTKSVSYNTAYAKILASIIQRIKHLEEENKDLRKIIEEIIEKV